MNSSTRIFSSSPVSRFYHLHADQKIYEHVMSHSSRHSNTKSTTRRKIKCTNYICDRSREDTESILDLSFSAAAVSAAAFRQQVPIMQQKLAHFSTTQKSCFRPLKFCLACVMNRDEQCDLPKFHISDQSNSADKRPHFLLFQKTLAEAQAYSNTTRSSSPTCLFHWAANERMGNDRGNESMPLSESDQDNVQ